MGVYNNHELEIETIKKEAEPRQIQDHVDYNWTKRAKKNANQLIKIIMIM